MIRASYESAPRTEVRLVPNRTRTPFPQQAACTMKAWSKVRGPFAITYLLLYIGIAAAWLS